MTECDMGVKFKMTQNVCGLGGFSCIKSRCSSTIFTKSTRNVWNGGFLGNPIYSETVWSHPEVCGMGGKSVMKVHTIWVFSNFHVRAC